MKKTAAFLPLSSKYFSKGYFKISLEKVTSNYFGKNRQKVQNILEKIDKNFKIFWEKWKKIDSPKEFNNFNTILT